MYNFFVEENCRENDCYYISGEDFNHIKSVLRMKVGEQILVSHNHISHLCQISEFESGCVKCKIVSENYQNTDLPISITLFQGLPKGDKMELIIQKAVELGVSEIIPVEMARSIVKLDEKKNLQKTARYQAISESAAKQSKRTSIPTVSPAISFKNALKKIDQLDLLIVPFESKHGIEDTKTALSLIKKGMKVGVMIGPEGGFDDKEILAAESVGGKTVSLGQRILRTETAAIASITMIMLYAEMNLQ